MRSFLQNLTVNLTVNSHFQELNSTRRSILQSLLDNRYSTRQQTTDFIPQENKEQVDKTYFSMQEPEEKGD